VKTIIGSAAMGRHLKSFREPKDIDYLSSDHSEFFSETTENGVVEYLPAPSWWEHKEYASLPELLTLKASHVFWTPRFRDKHIRDMATLLNLGHKIDKEMFYKLYDHWDSLYGKRSQSDQSQGVEDFFDDLLDRKMHHDDVHVILNPNPVYKKILVGDGTVNISEEKFETLLTPEEKLDVVREEVYVLSYERWNESETRSPALKYQRTLNYFIGHLAPTWLALFAMENYLILSTPKLKYKSIIDEHEQRQEPN